VISRLRCTLSWISRGPHGRGAVWTDQVVDPRLVAVLLPEWDLRGFRGTGDTLDVDVELMWTKSGPLTYLPALPRA
jgi:hypothetical protein